VVGVGRGVEKGTLFALALKDGTLCGGQEYMDSACRNSPNEPVQSRKKGHSVGTTSLIVVIVAVVVIVVALLGIVVAKRRKSAG